MSNLLCLEERSIDVSYDAQQVSILFLINYLKKKRTTRNILIFYDRTEPILPMDIIVAQLGKKPAVIIQYLVFQLIRHIRAGTSGFP